MSTGMANGNPRCRTGFGGEAAAAARAAEGDALARLRAILADGSPLSAGAAIEAADLLMRGETADRVAAIGRMHALVADARTPDAHATRAAGLILMATQRKAYQRPLGSK